MNVIMVETPAIIKACSCGRCFTKEEWRRLHLVGCMYIDEDENGPAEGAEYRNCYCGSTIAIKVEVPKESICSSLS